MKIQVEPWGDVAHQFDDLGRLNYAEADISNGKTPYSLDHATLADLSDLDMVHITTVREGVDLVGYALSVIMPRHLQFNEKMAQYLGIYLLPEYRRGRTGIDMLRADEKALRDKGVKVIYGGFAMGKDLKVLFDRLGWKMAEYTYTKWMDN